MCDAPSTALHAARQRAHASHRDAVDKRMYVRMYVCMYLGAALYRFEFEKNRRHSNVAKATTRTWGRGAGPGVLRGRFRAAIRGRGRPTTGQRERGTPRVEPKGMRPSLPLRMPLTPMASLDRDDDDLAQIGIVIGRRRRRPERANCILQLIRTPADPADPAEPVGQWSSSKAGGRPEEVCGHAMQVARILPGGLEILGCYVLCDPSGFDMKMMCSLLKSINAVRGAAFNQQDADVLVHVEYGRIRVRHVSDGRVRSSPTHNADLLHELFEVRVRYDVSGSLCDDDISHPIKKAAPCDVVENAIGSEMRRARQGVVRADDQSSMEDLVREQIKRGGEDHVSIDLVLPEAPDCRAALDCRAYLFRGETFSDALEAIQTDIELTLRARMHILKEVEELVAEVGGVEGAKATTGAWLKWPRSPARGFFSWKRGGGAYCGYMLSPNGGEGAHEVLERLRELVGPGIVDARRFSSTEVGPSQVPAPAARAKRTRTLGTLLSRCNMMLLGTLACAMLLLLSFI